MGASRAHVAGKTLTSGCEGGGRTPTRPRVEAGERRRCIRRRRRRIFQLWANSILISEPPNAVDVVVPFLSGIVEFAQFAVLVPLSSDGSGHAPSAAAQLNHLSWWFLCAATLTGLGVVTQLNLGRQMDRTTVFFVGGLNAVVLEDRARRFIAASVSPAVRGADPGPATKVTDR